MGDKFDEQRGRMTMKALLMDATPEGDAGTERAADALAAELEARGFTVERRRVAELDVRACTGCFGCWVKTPGECVIADDARTLAAAVIGSDVFAIVTPVRFGTYGSLGKSALDRMIPLIEPFFEKIDGEIHHSKRYERFPHLLALGTTTFEGRALVEEAAVFGHLVARNAINFHSPSHASALVGEHDDPAKTVARTLGEVLDTEEVAA